MSIALRMRTRGFTLIEIIAVVTILGLLATGIAIAVFRHFIVARLTLARTQATALRRAADAWRMSHGEEDCPSTDALVSGGVLDEASSLTDPWGTPYEIRCDGARTIARSLGPDKRASEDDVVVPERARGDAR